MVFLRRREGDPDAPRKSGPDAPREGDLDAPREGGPDAPREGGPGLRANARRESEPRERDLRERGATQGLASAGDGRVGSVRGCGSSGGCWRYSRSPSPRWSS